MKEFSEHSYTKVQIAQVNEQAAQGKSFFAAYERQYYQQLKQAISLCQGQPQLILLAGPSASGKTTTAHKLAREIVQTGRKALVVSLEDFYLDRDDIPLKLDGKPDLESVAALDLGEMNRCFQELFSKGHAMFPRYDFPNSRRSDQWHEVRCSTGEILIVEGIHGLHPKIVELMDASKILRLYVSVRTKYMDGEENGLIPKQLRLVRRMVRDKKFRNTSPAQTLNFWENVCAGEREYINPYRDTADFKIDSSMDYEPGVYRTLLTPFLREELQMEQLQDVVYFDGIDHETHAELLRELLDDLNRFTPLSAADIPADSVVREFLGQP